VKHFLILVLLVSSACVVLPAAGYAENSLPPRPLPLEQLPPVLEPAPLPDPGPLELPAPEIPDDQKFTFTVEGTEGYIGNNDIPRATLEARTDAIAKGQAEIALLEARHKLRVYVLNMKPTTTTHFSILWGAYVKHSIEYTWTFINPAPIVIPLPPAKPN